MAAIDDGGGAAEMLAQARANGRHMRRLQTAERRDAVHEQAAGNHAEMESRNSALSQHIDESMSADTLAASEVEQDALATDRAGLLADRSPDLGIEMDF